MKLQLKSALTAILASGILSAAAFAGDTATQEVTFEVQAINELAVSGNPAPLVVATATAGGAPNSVSESSSTYAITTNETDRKITGAIDVNMPSGVTLTVALAAPAGAASEGPRPLSTTATDLVTGISTLNESGKAITYQLSATSAAGVVSSSTRTVTLTITAGA